MKKVKRMLAVLLTAIMALAMATTAFAAEPPKGTLTVNVNENNTLKDQTIKVYKLFDLTVSGSNYAYKVNEDYKALIAKALLGQTENSTSEELYEGILALKGDAIQKFADDFTAAALTAGTSETETSGKLGEVELYQFTDLAYGYYLVYQTGTIELQSSLVSVAGETATVNLKGAAPSITKTATTPQADKTVEIGDVVTYTIGGKIPDTTGYDGYKYIIHDSLTGLDFVTDKNGTALGEGVTTLDVSVQIAGGEVETKQATLSGTKKREMTLDLSDWVISKQTTNKGQDFTVTYYAKVNAEAGVETTMNSAYLEYGNDSNKTTTTPVVEKTPTYPLQIHKLIKGNDSSYLPGATFRLYRTKTDAENNEKAIGVAGSAGNYTVDKTSDKYDMVSVGTELVGNAGMNLRLNGLAAGTYWLKETKAPDGYNCETKPFEITIAKVKTDVDPLEWTISKNNEIQTDHIIDIENSTGTILPGTGGMGTVLFTIIGVVLILGVAASFVISRKKHNR